MGKYVFIKSLYLLLYLLGFSVFFGFGGKVKQEQYIVEEHYIEKIRAGKYEEQMLEEDCQTIPFKMQISKKHCKTAAVENNLCLGKCRSTVYMRETDFRLVAECYACAPIVYKNVTATFECYHGRKHRKRIFRVIASCGCKRVSCQTFP